VVRFDAVYVATDDDRIAEAARGFGAEVLMTSDTCRNGTERCAEALGLLGEGVDMVVNLQGDAPLTPPWFLEALVDGLAGRQPGRAGHADPALRRRDACRAFKADRAAGRVGGTTAVCDSEHRALYFSKEVVPYTSPPYAPEEATPVLPPCRCLRLSPLGAACLSRLARGPAGTLEGLEQLRFLEAGHKVLCVEVEARGRKFWEFNNPEDIPGSRR
jgi:3-deoxy-manno-octulosonate cytidylyltransferase (CMP-KDO synthetase)